MKKEHAIDWIRKSVDKNSRLWKAIEALAPDITDSEDERIRKGLISYLEIIAGDYFGEFKKSDIIAYLEKQKPAEIKPRFKIGDTLKKKNKDYTFVVDKIQGGFYLTSDEHFFPIEEQDSWELLEQKPVELDEDIKMNLDRALQIIKKAKGNLQGYQSDDGIYECDKAIECLENFLYHGIEIEKTAEWRDVELTFRGEEVKVKRQFFRDDKGHEYSTTEQDEDVAWHALRAWCEKKGVSLYDLYPREEWSEDYNEEKIQTRFAFYTYKDDPSVLYLSNVFVEETSRNHGFGTRILKAAEKVAETIGATTISLKVKQNSPANAWYRKNGYGYVAFEDGYDWLEKNLEYMKPNKQEWSKEDKEKLSAVISLMKSSRAVDPFYDKMFLEGWLKSLRPPQYCENCKLKRSVENWKPSEEQMYILSWVANILLNHDGIVEKEVAKKLQSLYNDLQKLL